MFGIANTRPARRADPGQGQLLMSLPAKPPRRPLRRRIADRAINAVVRPLILIALLLPYPVRVRVFGQITTYLIAPVSGWRRRIRANLALVWPDMSKADVAHLLHAVPDHIGRSVIESYSPQDLRARLDMLDVAGPGLNALRDAIMSGRPLIIVSGHIGNYAVFRAWLDREFGNVGALYSPLTNAAFNRHYTAAMADTGEPLFPRTHRGVVDMIQHLRSGHAVAMLFDQREADGVDIPFLGQPALVTLSPAELALRHDAMLIAAYTIRQSDGLTFATWIEDAIPHSDPVTMMTALTKSLESQVIAHPEQWLWTHRRWRR